jgi:hypothetical protein
LPKLNMVPDFVCAVSNGYLPPFSILHSCYIMRSPFFR